MNTNKKTVKKFQGKKFNPKGDKPKYTGKDESLGVNSSQKDSEFKDETGGITRKDLMINDPEWYTANMALASTAGQIAFPYSTGGLIKEIRNFSSPAWNLLGAAGLSDNWYAPGVCRVNIVPCFGWNDNETSPVNIAAESLYAYIRKHFTGTLRATKNDFIKYMCDMGTALALINWGFRAAGTYAYYEYGNEYLCKTVMDAQGISYVSFRDMGTNLFCTRMNDLISRLGALVCPDTMSFFKRSAFLYKHMYVDGGNVRDQMYCFTPVGYYDHVMDDSHEASYLKFTYITGWDENGAITVDQYFDILEEYINHMFYSFDLGTMSGYLAKAFEGHLLGFELLNPEFKTAFLNSRDVLEQIKHGYVNPYIDLTTLDLYEDDTDIKHLISHPLAYATISESRTNLQRVHMELDWIYNIQNNFFNVAEPGLTPEYVFEWSRLMVSYEQVQFSSNENDFNATAHVHCGSDFIRNIVVYRFVQNYNDDTGALETGKHCEMFDLNYVTQWHDNYVGASVMAPETCAAICRNEYAVHALRDFPYAPKFVEMVMPRGGQSQSYPTSGFLGYTQNTECYHGIVPEETLRLVHKVAWYNMIDNETIQLLN